MKPKKVHVLYEYGPTFRPNGSAFIRLLRPLTHPSLRGEVEMSMGMAFSGQQADIVIVDRLWRPDVSLTLVKKLVRDIRQAKAKLFYALDDNFFDLPAARGRQWDIPVVEFLLHQADGVIVTTENLREVYRAYNPNIFLLSNSLDERLLVPRSPGVVPLFPEEKKIIGYMGTLTHDEDLQIVAPALQTLYKNYQGKIEFQIISGIKQSSLKSQLEGLPVCYIDPPPGVDEYPLFMLWFTAQTRWDIAIAPLANTRFNHSKSDIKFLDYCALGAPGVYSRAPAYQTSIQHMETGLLVENRAQAWIEAVEVLLKDEQLRARIAQNAYRYLHAKRVLAHRAADWLQIVNSD